MNEDNLDMSLPPPVVRIDGESREGLKGKKGGTQKRSEGGEFKLEDKEFVREVFVSIGIPIKCLFLPSY